MFKNITIQHYFNLLILFIFFTAPIANIFGQRSNQSKRSILFTGNLYHSENMLSSIPYVNLSLKNNMGTNSNINGEFSIYVSVQDTLTFSHIGFLSTTVYISELGEATQIVKNIYLVKDTFNLTPFVVSPYKNYEDFKNAFINMEIEYNYELVNAQNNINLCLYVAQYIAPKLEVEDYQEVSLQQQTDNLIYKGQIAPNNMIDIFKATGSIIGMFEKKKQNDFYENFINSKNGNTISPLQTSPN